MYYRSGPGGEAGSPAATPPQEAPATPLTYVRRKSVPLPLGQVYDLEFARDGTCLAAGCEGGLVIYNVLGNAPNSWVRCGNVTSVALHPEGMAGRIVNLDDWRLHILHGLRERGPHPRIDKLIE